MSSVAYIFFVPSLFVLPIRRAYARKKGRKNVTVDDLVQVITPEGRGEHFSVHVSIFLIPLEWHFEI